MAHLKKIKIITQITIQEGSWSSLYKCDNDISKAKKSTDYGLLIQKLGIIYYAHGVIPVIGGMLFGTALYIRDLTHPVIALILILASLLSFITGLLHLPELLFVIANFVRNGSFVAIGIYKLDKSKTNFL
jgi:hypothetical protein